MVYFLTFLCIVEKQNYTTQKWPRLLNAIFRCSSWFLHPNCFYSGCLWACSNSLWACSVGKPFSANSVRLARPQVVKSHHFHLYLSNMGSLKTDKNDQKSPSDAPALFSTLFHVQQFQSILFIYLFIFSVFSASSNYYWFDLEEERGRRLQPALTAAS